MRSASACSKKLIWTAISSSCFVWTKSSCFLFRSRSVSLARYFRCIKNYPPSTSTGKVSFAFFCPWSTRLSERESMVCTRSSALKSEASISSAGGPAASAKNDTDDISDTVPTTIENNRPTIVSPDSSTMDDKSENVPLIKRTTRGRRASAPPSTGKSRPSRSRQLGTTTQNTSSRSQAYDSKNSSLSSSTVGSSTRPVPDFSAFSYEPGMLENSSLCGDTQENGAGSKACTEDSNPAIEQIKHENELSPPTTPARKTKPKTGGSSTGSSRKRQRIEPGSLNPPNDWEHLYSLVEELRSDRTAPVDSDGAEALPQRDLGDKVYRFQVLIALMLSSQTKDAIVGDAMRALQQHGLTVENIRSTSEEELNQLIYKVGFRNNKTKYIKQATEIITTQYDGDIPSTAEEMMQNLPGVGPKMAYIVESIAFGRTTGIGVDTHMHRMFNQLNWVKSTTPEGTREQLEGWLPRDKWSEINLLWVGFGQESQQQKEKMLRKAMGCTRPKEALALLKRVGLDYRAEGIKYGLEEEVKAIMNDQK